MNYDVGNKIITKHKWRLVMVSLRRRRQCDDGWKWKSRFVQPSRNQFNYYNDVLILWHCHLRGEEWKTQIMNSTLAKDERTNEQESFASSECRARLIRCDVWDICMCWDRANVNTWTGIYVNLYGQPTLLAANKHHADIQMAHANDNNTAHFVLHSHSAHVFALLAVRSEKLMHVAVLNNHCLYGARNIEHKWREEKVVSCLVAANHNGRSCWSATNERMNSVKPHWRWAALHTHPICVRRHWYHHFCRMIPWQ